MRRQEQVATTRLLDKQHEHRIGIDRDHFAQAQANIGLSKRGQHPLVDQDRIKLV